MVKLPTLPENALLKDLFSQYPENARSLMSLVNDVLRGPGELSIANRELIAAYVSGLNSCTFCFGSHKQHAIAFGIEEDLLDAMMEDLSEAPLPKGMYELLSYLSELNVLPTRLTQNKMDAVLASGISEKALFEGIQIAALFNMMNRIVEGTGVSFDYDKNSSAHPAISLGENAKKHTYV